MNYYNEVKTELIRNEAYKQVKDYSKNRHDLETYYNVGKLLIEAQGGEERAKYGNGLIKEYSKRLTEELGKGYSQMNLKNMRRFYIFIEKRQAMPVQRYCSDNRIKFIEYKLESEVKEWIITMKLKQSL